MSSRRSLRSGHVRRRTTRESSSQGNSGEGACIDLTVDIGGDEVIDLTHNTSNLMDSPVVVISAADDVGPMRRRRGSGRRGRRRIDSRSSSSSFGLPSSSHDPLPSSSTSSSGQIDLENSDDELPDIPFEIPKESSKANSSYLKSPPLQIQCPVCLDDLKQIKASKKKVMSTICGHIFCDECIVNAIRTYRSCPTCRKTLAQNKVHPLFL